MDIQTVTKQFVNQFVTQIEAMALEEARAKIVKAIGGDLGGTLPVAGKRPGRPRKQIKVAATKPAKPKKYKQGYNAHPMRWICVVPGCKNKAAPRFGMACSDLHKNVPKAKLVAYRAKRNAEIHGLAAPVKAKAQTKIKAKAKTIVAKKTTKTITKKVAAKTAGKTIKVVKAKNKPLTTKKLKNGVS